MLLTYPPTYTSDDVELSLLAELNGMTYCFACVRYDDCDHGLPQDTPVFKDGVFLYKTWGDVPGTCEHYHCYGADAVRNCAGTEFTGVLMALVSDAVNEAHVGMKLDRLMRVEPETVPLTAEILPLLRKHNSTLRMRYEWWLESCREDRAEGYSKSHCEHGTNLWVDWDPICGPCEDGITMGDPVQRRRVALDTAYEEVRALTKFADALVRHMQVTPSFAKRLPALLGLNIL